MSKARVFIDGHAGTTGLRIRELLSDRDDLEILEIEEARRKDRNARAELLNGADVSILCLPDEAAREAAELTENPKARLIDASTAHRVAEGWIYGLPELSAEQRDRVRQSRRVANPGCYPTGFLLAMRPLVDAGVVPRDAPITIHALSGYSGGGHKLISKWEDPEGELSRLPFEAPYALTTRHKHIPEMQSYSGLTHEPQFVPAVGPFLRGMRVQVPLHQALLASPGGADRVHDVLAERYADEPLIEVRRAQDGIDERSFDPRAQNGSNRVTLDVIGSQSGHALVIATLDNLGKGAAGAAVQTLNLLVGVDELTGLAPKP